MTDSATAAAPAPGVRGPGPPAQVLRAVGQRRAWLLAAATALAVLIYLVAWSAYAEVHQGDRYVQLDPGAGATVQDGRTRLLSLTRTDRLLDAEGGQPQVAGAGTTFVVAELELTQQRPVEFVFCGGVLLGPGGRTWTPAGTEVQRRTPYCQSDDVVVGRPYRYEEVYLVPLVYADRLGGVALPDSTTAARTPVLRPPG